MASQFVKRQKRTSRQREELEDRGKVEEGKDASSQSARVTIVEEDYGTAPAQPLIKRKIIPAANVAPVPSAVTGEYYHTAGQYSASYLKELGKSNVVPHAAAEAVGKEQEKSGSGSEAEPQQDVEVAVDPVDEEIDESDKEKAQEAREIRSHMRKLSGNDPSTMGMANQEGGTVDVEEANERAALYKSLYFDKKPPENHSESEEEQRLHDWEDEMLTRGLGKSTLSSPELVRVEKNDETEVAMFSSEKITLASKFNKVLRDIRSKCSSLSIDSVQFCMQKKIKSLEVTAQPYPRRIRSR